MNNIEIIQKAIEILEPIPTEKWICYSYTNLKDACCGVGHYARLRSDNPEDYSIKNVVLSKDAEKLQVVAERLGYKLTDIGDGRDERFQLETPKERFLACLREMLKNES